MSLPQIIPLKMNARQQHKVMLTNTIKMLTNRGFLNADNIDKNIQDITARISDDNTYIVKSDVPGTNDKYVIKFMLQKITAISKSTGILDFLNNFKNDNKIVIVTDVSKKAIKQLDNGYPKTEIFLDKNLLIDVIAHELQPTYRVIVGEEREEFVKKYTDKKRQLPKMFKTDPAARYYNMKVGDICQIIRKSTMTGVYPTYRIVVPAPMK